MCAEAIPNRSHGKIQQLPADVREQIDNWIIGNPDRLTYQEISDELAERGYTIGKSLIGRYARRFATQLDRHRRNLERARQIADQLRGQDIDPEDATFRLAQSLIVEALANAENLNVESIKDLLSVAKSIGHIGATRISREKLEQTKRQAIDAAKTEIKAAISEALAGEPQLIDDLLDVTDAAAQRVIEREK